MTSFFKRWGQGIKNITAEQQLNAKLFGHIGSIAGVIFAMFYMVRAGLWYWWVFMFFIIFLQVLEIIKTKQQLDNMLEIKELIKSREG